MVVVAIAIVVALVAVGIGGFFAVRRRQRVAAADPAPPPAPVEFPPPQPPPEPAPMTGLEDALSSITDGSGTTIAERLDAEADAVDDLRVSNDTGPLLRRALDRVVDHDADE